MADNVPGQSAVAPPAGSPPAAGNPPAVPAPPADGSVAGSPPASLEDNVGFKQLREQYEATKAEAEKWKKLGDFDQVSQLYQTTSEKLAQAMTIGRSLGYTEQQIRTSMLEDPKGTLLFLQQEYAKPAGTTREEMDKLLEQRLAEKVKPIQDQFEQTINTKAQTLYEGERERLFKAEFGDGLPDDNKEELYEILDGLMAADNAAMQRLKFHEQVSDVKRHMEAAKTVFLKRHNAYIAHERGKSAPKNGNGNGKAPEKPNGSFMDRKLSDGRTVRDVLTI